MVECLYTRGYTGAAAWATSATPLPMWDPEGYRMVPLPNMVADFRDTPPQMAEMDVGVVDCLCYLSCLVYYPSRTSCPTWRVASFRTWRVASFRTWCPASFRTWLLSSVVSSIVSSVVSSV